MPPDMDAEMKELFKTALEQVDTLRGRPKKLLRWYDQSLLPLLSALVADVKDDGRVSLPTGLIYSVGAVEQSMRSVSLRNRQITPNGYFSLGNLGLMRRQIIYILSECVTAQDLRLTPQVELHPTFRC